MFASVTFVEPDGFYKSFKLCVVPSVGDTVYIRPTRKFAVSEVSWDMCSDSGVPDIVVTLVEHLLRRTP